MVLRLTIGARYFPLLQIAQAGSGVRPASDLLGSGVSFLGVKRQGR